MREHNSSIYYMQQSPKLEDFFTGGGGGDSAETQDSSLTHLYDHQHHGDGASAAWEQQDLKSIIGFPSFSANSGSEVEDSAFAGQTQSSPGESGTELVAYSHCPTANGLSLNVNGVNRSSNAVDNSESSKKIGDTFGQRTSIYRGVTRY